MSLKFWLSVDKLIINNNTDKKPVLCEECPCIPFYAIYLYVPDCSAVFNVYVGNGVDSPTLLGSISSTSGLVITDSVDIEGADITGGPTDVTWVDAAYHLDELDLGFGDCFLYFELVSGGEECDPIAVYAQIFELFKSTPTTWSAVLFQNCDIYDFIDGESELIGHPPSVFGC